MNLDSNEEKSDIKFKNLMFYILIIIMIMFGISNSFMMYGAFVFSAVMLFLLKDTNLRLQMMLFLLPFSMVFVKERVNGFPFYFLLMCEFTLLTYSTERVKKYKYLGITSFLLVFDILLVSIAHSALSIRAMYMVVGIVMISGIVESNTKISIENCATFYALGIILAAVIAKFADFIPNLSNYIVSNHGSLGTTRFCGLYGNPNYYTYDISIAICMVLYLMSKSDKVSVFYILLVVLLIFVGVLSISMSFVLATIFTVVLYLFFAGKGAKSQRSKILICVGFFIAFYFLNQNESVSTVVERFMNLDFSLGMMGDTTSNRTTKWAKFLQWTLQDYRVFFWGAGMEATTESAHNLYIEYPYFFGIIGTSLFIVWINTLIKKARFGIERQLKSKRFLIILIPVLFRAFAISLVGFMNFWMTLGLIFVIYKQELNDMNVLAYD